MRTRIFGWLLAALLGLVSTVHAQVPTERELASLFRALIEDRYATDAQLDAVLLQRAPWSAEQLAIRRPMLRAVMRHEAMPAYMAAIMLPMLKADPKADFRRLGAEAMMMLQSKGVARLPEQRQAELVEHIIAVARSAGAKQCTAVLRGKVAPREIDDMELAYLVKAPLATLEAVTRLYQEAAEAELSRFPDVRRIDAGQAGMAAKVYALTIRERVRSKFTPAQLRELNSGELEDVPATDVCDMLTEAISAMLDMPEPYRAWQLVRFAQGLQ
ncbi:hypothetical protein [Ramlibacter sp. PS4R-6]|uniref:hypothetical protein n=1 Tax=Ramlibacter sp. PS4R-6 TaxID=3133438 RepID=UPI0030A56595